MKLSDEMKFFIFLLEHYARYKGVRADKMLALWDKVGVTNLIYKMYWRYHSEALENAYADIDLLLKEHESAPAYPSNERPPRL